MYTTVLTPVGGMVPLSLLSLLECCLPDTQLCQTSLTMCASSLHPEIVKCSLSFLHTSNDNINISLSLL